MSVRVEIIRVVRKFVREEPKAYSRSREAITLICTETFTVAFGGFHLDGGERRAIG